MSTQEKIAAVIAAVNEHAAIYAGAKAPATVEAYDNVIIEGLRKGLVEKIAKIFSDQ